MRLKKSNTDVSAGTRGGKGEVDRLLSPEQLAERWQVEKSHVYRLTRDGVLDREAVVRLGRYYRYRLEGIEEFERGGGVAQRSDAA